MYWNHKTEQALSKAFENLRAQRVSLFVEKLKLNEKSKVLDLGSEDGSYLAKYYPWPHRIIIADIDDNKMIKGVREHNLMGYRVIPEGGRLPFKDNEFDAVWCNSVIEHVTVPKSKLSYYSDSIFKKLADLNQKRFAGEVRRVSKAYFVQTPYKHFPIESHSVMPLVAYLPQGLKFLLAKYLKNIWVKRWKPDFHLYDLERFTNHFPDSQIFYEKCLMMKKSMIAFRSKQVVEFKKGNN